MSQKTGPPARVAATTGDDDIGERGRGSPACERDPMIPAQVGGGAAVLAVRVSGDGAVTELLPFPAVASCSRGRTRSVSLALAGGAAALLRAYGAAAWAEAGERAHVFFGGRTAGLGEPGLAGCAEGIIVGVRFMGEIGFGGMLPLLSSWAFIRASRRRVAARRRTPPVGGRARAPACATRRLVRRRSTSPQLAASRAARCRAAAPRRH